jgi:hypothetical protein
MGVTLIWAFGLFLHPPENSFKILGRPLDAARRFVLFAVLILASAVALVLVFRNAKSSPDASFIGVLADVISGGYFSPTFTHISGALIDAISAGKLYEAWIIIRNTDLAWLFTFLLCTAIGALVLFKLLAAMMGLSRFVRREQENAQLASLCIRDRDWEAAKEYLEPLRSLHPLHSIASIVRTLEAGDIKSAVDQAPSLVHRLKIQLQIEDTQALTQRENWVVTAFTIFSLLKPIEILNFTRAAFFSKEVTLIDLCQFIGAITVQFGDKTFELGIHYLMALDGERLRKEYPKRHQLLASLISGKASEAQPLKGLSPLETAFVHQFILEQKRRQVLSFLDTELAKSAPAEWDEKVFGPICANLIEPELLELSTYDGIDCTTAMIIFTSIGMLFQIYKSSSHSVAGGPISEEAFEKVLNFLKTNGAEASFRRLGFRTGITINDPALKTSATVVATALSRNR